MSIEPKEIWMVSSRITFPSLFNSLLCYMNGVYIYFANKYL